MKVPVPAPAPTPLSKRSVPRHKGDFFQVPADEAHEAGQDLARRDPRPPVPPPAAPAGEGAGQPPPGAAESDGQPFVTFYVDKELFAFPMNSVREIIRMPEVVRVPLSSSTLEGIANLRGQMLPVVNLRGSFHFSVQPYDASTRVIVIEEGGLVGFIVDRVAMVISVQHDQMEPVASIELAIDTELLAGLIKGIPGHPMVMLLDVPRLVRGQSRALSNKGPAEGGTGLVSAQDGPATQTEEEISAHERHLVSFVVADQEYAFPIERVQEIVQVPEHLSQVPKAQSHVLGVMTLRNRLLPLVSLRQMFHLPPEALSAEQRIVVIELGPEQGQRGGVVGIVMDAVNEVLRVPERLVDPLPSFLSSRDAGSEIEAICRLSEGKRLVSILSVDRLFQHAALREALHTDDGPSTARGQEGDMTQVEDSRGEAQAQVDREARSTAVSDREARSAAVIDEEEQLVVFRLDGQEYGVGIESVQEIIRLPESVIRVPKTVQSLLGVVNVRGQVLPVVDFRSRFGLGPIARDDRQRIVVLSMQGAHTGFVVDSVSEVLKVPRSTIDAVPARSEERAEGRLIGRIANLQKQKRMILLLDVDCLLDRSEMTALTQVRAAA